MKKIKQNIGAFLLFILGALTVYGAVSCDVYLCKQKYKGASTIGCLSGKR